MAVGRENGPSPLWRVVDPQTIRNLFPGGFFSQHDAECWALAAWIRRDIGDYKVMWL